MALLVLLTASVAGLLPLQPQRVGSGSMHPAVPTGALLLVDRGDVTPHHRDVVTVSADLTGEPLVKRVVATAGETVAVEDGVLVVDGQAVCEPAVDPAAQDGVWFGPVTVPVDTVFLLGDDRAGSIDSRVLGPVPVADLTGRVLGRLWPRPGPLGDGLC